MKKKRWNRVYFLAPVILFITGAAIFLYPAISNYIAEKKQWNVIQTYDAKMNHASKEEIKKEWKKAKIYNENLIGQPVHDPFVVGSGFVLPNNYEDVLRLSEDGIMCYLRIPKLHVHMPIYHGTAENVLRKGGGHLEMTSLPIGGKGNHAMICAHRGLPSAELFSRLDELHKNDLFYIHVLDQVHAYEVEDIQIIKPEDMKYIHFESKKDLITLMTCTPYGVNTHRLLVRGRRIAYKNEQEKEMRIENNWKLEYMIVFFGGIAFFVLKKGYRAYENKRLS